MSAGFEARGQSYLVKPPLKGPGSERRQRPRPSRFTPRRPLTPSAENPADKRTISVEILSGTGGQGLAAQRWGQAFAKHGVSLRVRRALPTDEPGVREKRFGTLRQVVVTAQLGRDGKLYVDGKSFGLRDETKLGEWLRELKTYGPQGAPDGQPLWGLSEIQFSLLSTKLSGSVESRIAGLPLEQAIDKLGISEEHPVRLSTSARAWLRDRYGRDLTVRQNATGLSRGTGLAMLLNDFGLGFRPLRTPEGDIELAVEPLTQASDAWPVGWPLEKTQKQSQAAPELFEFLTAGFEEEKLTDVLDAISSRTGVPIRVDRFRAAAIDVDVDRLQVTYPRKRTTWWSLLRSIVVPAKLRHEVRRDEAGKPFVWIAPILPDKALEKLREAQGVPSENSLRP